MASAGDGVAAAQAGDGRAFEALLAPALDPAFRLAMVMLKDRAAAEDAVQEACLKAWRHLGRFRAGAEFRPWLLAIVANECRSARRSPWRRWLTLELWAAPPRPAEGIEDRLDLDAALDRLRPQDLLPLTLRYHLDLPMPEIAEVLGCSEGAARVRIHRALAALHPLLAVEVG